MIYHDTPIAGVKVIEFFPNIDPRGSFTKLFDLEDMNTIFNFNVHQINLSYTYKAGTIRGLHYQKSPFDEFKVILCLQGKVYDVAIDLRPNSITLYNWFAFELEQSINKAILIPDGCAHGFQTLEDASKLLYFHSAPYAPNYEDGIKFDDPKISIKWPLVCSCISNRDKNLPYL